MRYFLVRMLTNLERGQQRKFCTNFVDIKTHFMLILHSAQATADSHILLLLSQAEQKFSTRPLSRTKTFVVYPKVHIEPTAVTSRLAERRPPLRLLTPRYCPADAHHRTSYGGSGLL